MYFEYLKLTVLLVLAIFIIVYGFLLIFAPVFIANISRKGNQIQIILDISIFRHRRIWGSLLLLAGSYLFYMAYSY